MNTSKPKQNTVGVPIVIAAVVVAIAVAVGLAFVLGGDDENAGDEVPTVSVASTVVDVPIAECSDVRAGTAGSGEAAAGDLADFVVGELVQPVAVDGVRLADHSAEISQGVVTDPALCAAAPAIAGYDYGGDVVTIDAAADGPTLVVVLAHWCPHCNAEVPRLNEWRDSGAVPDGLAVVGISTAVESDGDHYPPNEWIDEVDWTWPVIADDADSTAARAFGTRGFPTLLLFDGDGQLRWRASGEQPTEVIASVVDKVVTT